MQAEEIKQIPGDQPGMLRLHRYNTNKRDFRQTHDSPKITQERKMFSIRARPGEAPSLHRRVKVTRVTIVDPQIQVTAKSLHCIRYSPYLPVRQRSIGERHNIALPLLQHQHFGQIKRIRPIRSVPFLAVLAAN
ncbi:hypothetical protein D3C74_421920 [compost metagenome]